MQSQPQPLGELAAIVENGVGDDDRAVSGGRMLLRRSGRDREEVATDGGVIGDENIRAIRSEPGELCESGVKRFRRQTASGEFDLAENSAQSSPSLQRASSWCLDRCCAIVYSEGGDMFNNITLLWRAPARRKLVLAEAFACTLSAWATVRFASYATWRQRLGEPAPLTDVAAIEKGAPREALLEDIAWAHRGLARVFGRHFTCLMLALSARSMLARRKRPSVIVLGVRLGKQGAREPIDAHAWVLSGGSEIVGGETRIGHTPVIAYRDRASDEAETLGRVVNQ